MCLLERVIDYDDQSIRLETQTHRSLDNPLRLNGRLRSVNLCEYGAQAMAVHGALKSREVDQKAQPGRLVALRSVTFARDLVEDLPGVLVVTAQCLQASATSLQYQFVITHDGCVIAEGRAAVMLGY